MGDTSADPGEGVSLGGSTGQWVPPGAQLESRADAGVQKAHDTPAQPATPRKPSKRYPEDVRASLKTLRRSFFAALKKKKKAHLDGIEYVRELLLNAESYTPPEPKGAPAKPEDSPPKAHDSEATTETEGIKEENDDDKKAKEDKGRKEGGVWGIVLKEGRKDIKEERKGIKEGRKEGRLLRKEGY